MMMPANFSAVAENEMTYVVGGSLVDVLAPAMTTANWQNVSGNVIKIVGNSFLDKYTNDILGQLFDGNYVPGDVIGFSVKNLDKAYNKGYNTFGGNWGFAVGALNRWHADPGRPVRYLHPGQRLHRSGN
ncbi:MAG: hypothetical protein ACLUSW_02300 [Faecalibacterium sp.]